MGNECPYTYHTPTYVNLCTGPIWTHKKPYLELPIPLRVRHVEHTITLWNPQITHTRLSTCITYNIRNFSSMYVHQGAYKCILHFDKMQPYWHCVTFFNISIIVLVQFVFWNVPSQCTHMMPDILRYKNALIQHPYDNHVRSEVF